MNFCRKLSALRRYSLLAAVAFLYLPSHLGAQCNGCPNPSFRSAARSHSVGGTATKIIVADFDRDGNSDVAALYSASSTNLPGVAVLLGTATGQLEDPVPYSLPSNSSSFFSGAAGDFDGDAKPDLITAVGTTQLYFLRGLGDGTLASPLSIASVQPVYRLVGGDFNGDGDRDVAYADDWSQGSTIWVRLGDGGGGLAAAVGIPAGPGLREFAVADLNRDAVDDILVANGYSDSISVLSGASSGGFGPARNYFVGQGPNGIAVADWNGDGWLDIGASTVYQNGIAILWASGMGNFSDRVLVDPSIGYQGGSILSGDFNGDGRPDLLVTAGYGRLVLYSGDGAGQFLPRMIAGIAGESTPADFNRDGITDLATASRDVAILRGSATGRFSDFYSIGGSYGVVGPPVFGDFDGDGRTDVLAGDTGSMIVVWNDPGGFTPSMQFQTVNEVARAGGDFNGDGRTDVAASSSTYPGNEIAIYLAFGTRSFYRLGAFTVGSSPGEIATADFNGDSKVDLAVVNSNSSSISILLGVGNGTFSGQSQFAVGAGPTAAEAVDLNRDDDPDLAVLRADGTLVVLTGDGAGGFDSISTLFVGANSSGLLAADVNADGDPDIATTSAYGRTLSVLLGNGNGGFGAPSQLTNLEVDIGALAAGNVNGDAHVDLVARWGGGFYMAGGAWVFLGDGTGNFAPSFRFFAGPGANATAAGDLDADGRTDFAVTMAASGFSALALFRNTNCLSRRLGVVVDVPESSVPDVLFSSQPVLQVVDDGDNVVVCDSGLVTSSIVPGAGPPGAVLQGDTVFNAVAGIATFTDLSIDLPGSGYQLLFSHDLAGVTRSRYFVQGVVAVNAPGQACPYSAGHLASVPDGGAGASYLWNLTNGVITSGTGTNAVEFKVGPSGQAILSVTVNYGDGSSASGVKTIAVDRAAMCVASVGFFTVESCRLIDTRSPAGPFGGPGVDANATRIIQVTGQCGVPANATSISLNLTVVAPPEPGNLSLFPANTPLPLFSSINFRTGFTRANSAIAPLGAGGDLAVFCSLGNPGIVDFVIDVNGYFR